MKLQALVFLVVYSSLAQAELVLPGAVKIVGPEEVVFDWTNDRCEDIDIPDLPARAFRDDSGNVQILSTHYRNRRLIGESFASLQRECTPVMESHYDWDPAAYNGNEWLAATYTTDGKEIHALVHNEFQGNNVPGMCPGGNYAACWYNAITYAYSNDGGKSYTHTTAPSHLVASLPYEYVPDTGPYGIFEPSNIIYRKEDGYFYNFLHLEAYGSQKQGLGVMRTLTLDDPTSWRCWGGSAFDVSFIDPYLNPSNSPQDHVCEPVSPGKVGKSASSVSYNTYFNKYLLTSADGVWDEKRQELVFGFYYSLSDDLINWEPLRLMWEVKTWWQPELPGDALGYPALIDHNDGSRNFETTGRRNYLYFTRWHTESNQSPLYDRDLVRVPVEFTRIDGAVIWWILRKNRFEETE